MDVYIGVSSTLDAQVLHSGCTSLCENSPSAPLYFNIYISSSSYAQSPVN